MDPLGITSQLPLIVRGMMGTPDLMARVNPPLLKGWIDPSRVRVPSGKMTTEIPPLILAAARSMLAKAFLFPDRSMLM